MRKFFGPMGHVTRLTIESQVLQNNMLGDPTTRAVDEYVPPGHDGQGLPLLVDLDGFTGAVWPTPTGRPSAKTCPSAWIA